MLSLRRETDYAIQLLKILARRKGLISLNEVAETTGLSFLFLQKIARKLRQHKIIKAGHGVNGGYCLAVSPKSLNLKQIVMAVEGGCLLMPCAGEKTGSCAKKSCALKPKIKKINEQVIKLLTKIKLSQL